MRSKLDLTGYIAQNSLSKEDVKLKESETNSITRYDHRAMHHKTAIVNINIILFFHLSRRREVCAGERPAK